MNELFIPILLGTAREGRHTEKAARFVLERAKVYGGFQTELLDVRDFVSIPKSDGAMTEEKAAQWRDIMTRADGLIIVSPEYNHGYPGELKLMIDQIYDEYNHKPLAICGAGGGLGGGRMVEMLRIVAVELHMVPINTAVYFSNIKNLFDESGAIKDAAYQDRLKTLFDELVWYAAALKAARGQGK